MALPCDEPTVNNNGYNLYPSADTNGHGYCSAEDPEAVRVKVDNPTSKAPYAGISMIVLTHATSESSDVS